MCPPILLRFISSFGCLHPCLLSNLDFKRPFLHICKADWEVATMHTFESDNQKKLLWLLLTAMHEAVNANEKLKLHSDSLLPNIYFNIAAYVSELFYMNWSVKLSVAPSRIVNDFFFCSLDDHVDAVMKNVEKRLTFGSVSLGLGLQHYFALNSTQHENLSIFIHEYDILYNYESHPISRTYRHHFDSPLTNLDETPLEASTVHLNCDELQPPDGAFRFEVFSGSVFIGHCVA